MFDHKGKDDLFDSFWDLASLMPKKKKEPPRSTPTRGANPVDVCSDQQVSESGSPEEKLSLSTPKEELTAEYEPKDSPFIRKVKLYKRKDAYTFYDRFRQDAERYLSRVAPPCDHVSFFSYVPQYAQMTPSQLQFYFYWRDRCRCGEFISCDISYIWLLVYEVINLPDLIPPEEGVVLLCRVWGAYRQSYPKMDKYLTVWLADYCLIHRLPCPYEWIHSFLPAILENAGIKEFYLSRVSQMNEYGVHTLLSFCSRYDIFSSKFVKTLEKEEIRRLLRALVPVLERLGQEEAYGPASGEVLDRFTRDAFSGALCAHTVKYRIEVFRLSFRHDPALSGALTAAVKYAENRVRLLKKQKSRLSYDGLLPEDRALIDAYFDRHIPKEVPKQEPKPAYEKLYDAESTGVSFADAEQIESASWSNTMLLVPKEEADSLFVQAEEIVDLADATPTSNESTEREDSCPLTAEQIALLARIFDSGSAPADFKNTGLAEAINEAFMDIIGDIVIDMNEQTLDPIEDYREDVELWLQNETKK